MLKREHGTLLRAWHVAFDPQRTGAVGPPQFAAAARGVGFVGSAPAVFQELDREGRGFLKLGDLDEEAERITTEFRRLCKEQYGGSMCRAWQECLDTGNRRGLTRADLAAACAKLGFSVGDPTGYLLFAAEARPELEKQLEVYFSWSL